MADPNTPTPAPALDFDVMGALKAGYSETEIASYMASQTGFDLEGAKKAGYTDNEIVKHLAPVLEPAPKAIEAVPEPESGTLKGMGKAAGQMAIEDVAGVKTGVGAFVKSVGQAEGQQSGADVGLMRRLDEGEDFGALMKAAPNDLARLALRQYQLAPPEEKARIRQDAINAAAAPPGAVERAGTNILAAGHALSETAKKTFPLTPEEESRESVMGTKMLVGLVPYIGAGLAGGLPAVMAYGGVQAYGETYDDAKAKGARDDVAAGAALLSGVTQGTMMAVPVGESMKLFQMVPVALRGKVMTALAETAKSGAVLLGFSQASKIADNVVAQNTYEPTRETLQGVGDPKEMAVTAAVGALLPAAGAAVRKVLPGPTPETVAKKVMDTGTVDEAIDAARSVVDATPVDVETVAAQAREYGGAAEQQQGKLLQLFGGLNRGTVEQAADGGFHFRTGEGEDAPTHPFKVWDETAKRADGAEPTIDPALAAAQREHYGKLGIDLVYFENQPGIPFDGAVSPQTPNTIFLSNNPQRNAAQVAAHEVTHVLESTKLPDGTNLGDVLHQQITEGLTYEGLRHAYQTFGKTAPERAAFPAGPEGDSAHADAVVSHLVRELGADIGGEAPRFQSFVPKVIEAVEARYGLDAAKDVLRKLIDGLQNAMRTLRTFFAKPEEHAEYGQPETVSQNWVTNLGEVHDTLARMYAERFGSQAEKENATLVTMRNKAERDRYLRGEEQPPAAPEGFFDHADRTAPIDPHDLIKNAASGTFNQDGNRVAPINSSAPEAPASITPGAQQPAVAEVHQRIVTLRRWLEELGAKRREEAPASPQATLLKQTEAAILAKVRGVEERLTAAQAARLDKVRADLEALLNPTGDSPDMARVREALTKEQQRLADAAAVGSAAAPAGGRSNIRPRAARQEPARIEAVMPEPEAPKVEAKPVEQPAPAEAAPEPTPPPVVEAKAASVIEAAAPAEQTPIAATPPAEPPLSEAGRERAMREQAAEQIRWAVEEGGIPPEVVPQIAHLYRPEPGEDPSVAFHRAVDQWITLEEARATRAVMGDARALEETYANGERTADADTIGGEPTGTAEAARNEAPAPEAERPASAAPGGEPAGGSRVSGETAEGAPLAVAKPTRAAPRERSTTGAPGRVPPPEMLADAGEKIGGARKDRWSERGLRLSDLEGMTEGEAFQHTTKDQVWPKPDYAAMVENGASPEAAAMVKIIRDRLAAKPRVDSQEGRRHYIEMMGHVRDVLSNVKTAEEFRTARDAIVHEKAGVSRERFSTDEDAKAARQLLFSVYKNRSEPFGIDYSDRRKAQKMVEEGFPGKAEPWTRRYEVRQWGGDTFAVVSKGERRVIDGRKFETRDEAEAFARSTYEAAAKSGETAPLPKRPHLDSVQRTGADVRGGKDVTGDDFVKDFGFRGVEFGNWVASDERQKSVNLAYDALHDMAGVIGISPKAISLDGQLGLAFGARGSGSAAAHYEPGRLVINLTKLSGAGSLGHEWGHALDHYFGTLDTGQNTRGEPKGASGWYTKTDQRARYLTNLRPEMAEAFDKVMDAIFKREKPRAEAVRDTELRIENYQASIARQQERMEAAKAKDPEANKKFIKDSAVWIEQNKLQLQATERRLADLRDEEKPYTGQKISSSYYDEANKLSGKSGESGYWSRPTEMFARAFESYVFDKIKEEGRSSQYLVQGVEPERYASGYKGNPYPAAERPAINAAFDHLFKTMDERPGANGPALFSPKLTGESRERAYTPEERKAYENVGRVVEPRSIRDWLAETKQDLGKKIIAATMDRYIGVKENDPEGYMALRLANSTDGAVEAFKTEGTLKFDGHAYALADRNGGVEHALIRPLQGEAHDFLWWVAAHRAERLSQEDRENLWTQEDIATLKKTNRGNVEFEYELPNGTMTRRREAIYADSLRKLDLFNRNVLDLAVEAGLLKRDKVDALWSNPFYVPFYRQAEEGNHRFVGPTASSGFVKQNAFKTLKGGSEKLNNDLWQNAFGNWQHMIDASLSNKAVSHVLDVAASRGLDGATRITTQEALHLSDKEQKRSTVWAMRDGEKQYYRVDDPLLFTAVSVLEPIGDPAGLLSGARWFKRVLQIGVTSSPMFAVRNLIRDTEQTLAVAPSGLNVAANIAKGFKANDIGGALQNLARAAAGREVERLHLSDEAANAIAGGATMRLGAGTDSGLRNTGVGLMLNTPEAVQGFWNYIKTAARAYKEVLGQGEDANRLALYGKLAAEGSPHDYAALSARDLADFTLTGASPIVRAITTMVPFLNARMQGLYKVGRAAADADQSVALAVGGKVAGSMAKRVAVVLGATTALTLALDALYHDDEDYKNRTEYDRNTYFWFKVGQTQFRIPMGFEIAAMSRVAANGIEAFFDKEMTANRFAQNVWSILGTNLQLNPIPQALAPLYDVATNTGGTGQHIEPMGLERLRPEQRYTANSTLVARGASTAVNATMRAVPGLNAQGPSPIQLDYLVNAYGGWLATSIMGMADTVARSFSSEPVKPAPDLWATATQGMISTQPRGTSRYVEMLYTQGKEIEQAFNTYKDLLQRGQSEEAQRFFTDNKDALQKHGLVSGVMRLEGDLNRQIRMIVNNPDSRVTAEQKRIQIMQLQALKSRAAEQVFGAGR